MITHKTYTTAHFWNFGGISALNKLEDLREKAEDFIASKVKSEDVICISETRDAFASSITIWYIRD